MPDSCRRYYTYGRERYSKQTRITWTTPVSYTHLHQEITEKFENEFDNPDFYLENELFRLYENALKQLPKDYREAYEMNRNHRMTNKEIAEKLNVSPQTVNYRIGQALKLLRIALKDYLPLFILYFGLDIFKQSWNNSYQKHEWTPSL